MAEVPMLRIVAPSPHRLRLEWGDGAAREFTALWLLDNRPGARDEHSGQRLVDVADLPETATIRSVGLEGDALAITWPNGTQTRYPLEWLHRESLDAADERPELRPRRWLDGAALDGRQAFAWATLDAVASDDRTRLSWLTRLIEDGIGFVSEVPREDGAILDAVRRMGQVAETNYGRLFDVRSVAQPENLAYSDAGLGLHTDNPYREPVPGFQALHALETSPDGGESLFADGFALAEHLRANEPTVFRCLSSTPVPFLYRSANADLYSEKPLIRLDPRGRVAAVHYNNRSIAALQLAPREMDLFYEAYRRFATLLRDPRFQMHLKLSDGEMVIFDNQRILHGRTGFSSARHARHLQGCYLTRDSVLSAAALLRRSHP